MLEGHNVFSMQMVDQRRNPEPSEVDESQPSLRLPSSVGMGLPEGQFRVFLPKGSRLPCEASARFLTRLKEYNKAKIKIFMGEGEMIDDNIFLGEIGLDNIRLNKDGQALIDIIFQADRNYMLFVQLKDEPGKKSSNMTIRLPLDESLVPKGPPPGMAPSRLKIQQVDTEMLLQKLSMLEEKVHGMEKELEQHYKGKTSGGKSKETSESETRVENAEKESKE